MAGESIAVVGETADLLYGMATIAAHLGMSKRSALHQQEKGLLPTFKMGRTVCARRSTLSAHMADRESGASKGRLAPAGGTKPVVTAAGEWLVGAPAIGAHLGWPAAQVEHFDMQRRRARRLSQHERILIMVG